MGLSNRDAAVKDAQIGLEGVECASGMEQRRNNAAAKDAQIASSKEECAGGMEQAKHDKEQTMRHQTSKEAHLIIESSKTSKVHQINLSKKRIMNKKTFC